ncbi:MAG: carboxypeptidase-like regulatory domain-containing protein, partial [Cyclobacteriaceae bacterium]|nr:carboxypeptidase-like regulatory domain-containing protein [Cyclobacteriaceae bacterium]
MENSYWPVWLKKMLLLGMSLCIAGFSFAQDRTITGKVTSADDGSGIPGVNILVEGTTSGTVTDLEGSYRLTVPDGASLLYSSIGYQTQRVVVGTQTVIDVSLATDVTQLSEVVVTGYGTQERGDVTAAISSLNMEEIQSVPLTNLNQAFQGRVPGLTVTN